MFLGLYDRGKMVFYKKLMNESGTSMVEETFHSKTRLVARLSKPEKNKYLHEMVLPSYVSST